MERGGFALVLTVIAASIFSAQPGHSILGNGRVTVVYSDDSRIPGRGIQHFYFKDYTADYVASTSFGLTGASQVGMKNFFTAQTTTPLAQVLCFVHPEDAVVLSLTATGAKAGPYRFEAQLRKESLTSLRTTGRAATAVWSNGTVLVVAPKDPHDQVTASGSSVVVTGNTAQIWMIPASSEAQALSKLRALEQDPDLKPRPRSSGSRG